MRKCECGHKYGNHFRRTENKPCRMCDCDKYRPREIVKMSLENVKEIIESKGIA